MVIASEEQNNIDDSINGVDKHKNNRINEKQLELEIKFKT